MKIYIQNTVLDPWTESVWSQSVNKSFKDIYDFRSEAA